MILKNPFTAEVAESAEKNIMVLTTAVVRVKAQSSQRKPKTWNGKVIHHYGESAFNPNSLISSAFSAKSAINCFIV